MSTGVVKKIRNLEKRREKSRYAARHRRERESEIFSGLYDIVPIVREPTVTHIDRIAVLRLAAGYCRSRHVARKVLTEASPKKHDECSDELEDVLAQAADGFIYIVDNNGVLVYVSQGVSFSLGLTQSDLIGHNLYAYIHGDDRTTLEEVLAGRSTPEREDGTLGVGECLIRVKSVLTARGRNLNLRSAIYKAVSFAVVKCTISAAAVAKEEQERQQISTAELLAEFPDFVVGQDDEEEEDNAVDDSPRLPKATAYFFFYGTPVTYPTNVEKVNEVQSFMTRHSMDMKFSYCHEKVSAVLGYDVKTLVGASFFSIVHAADLAKLTKAIKMLLNQGQAVLGIYRLLLKKGGWLWIYTEASLVSHNTRGHRGQYVVCMHQIIGEEEVRNITAKPVYASLKKSTFSGRQPTTVRTGGYCAAESAPQGSAVGRPFLRDGNMWSQFVPPSRFASPVTSFVPAAEKQARVGKSESGILSVGRTMQTNRGISTRSVAIEKNACEGYTGGGSEQMFMHDEIDDLSLRAPFIAPDDMLSLEIPSDPFEFGNDIFDFSTGARVEVVLPSPDASSSARFNDRNLATPPLYNNGRECDRCEQRAESPMGTGETSYCRGMGAESSPTLPNVKGFDASYYTAVPVPPRVAPDATWNRSGTFPVQRPVVGPTLPLAWQQQQRAPVWTPLPTMRQQMEERSAAYAPMNGFGSVKQEMNDDEREFAQATMGDAARRTSYTQR